MRKRALEADVLAQIPAPPMRWASEFRLSVLAGKMEIKFNLWLSALNEILLGKPLQDTAGT